MNSTETLSALLESSTALYSTLSYEREKRGIQPQNHYSIVHSPLHLQTPVKHLTESLAALRCSETTILALLTIFDESLEITKASMLGVYDKICHKASFASDDEQTILATFAAVGSNFQLQFEEALHSLELRILREAQTAKSKLLAAPATPLACGKFTSKNLNILFTAYENKNKLSTADKVALAVATGLNSKQIAVWFANQRSRKTNPKKSTRGLQQKKYQKDNVDLSAYVSSSLKCEPIPADPIYAPATLSPPASTFIPFIPATESSAFLSSTSATRGISPMSMVGSEYSFHEDMEEIMDHLPPNLAQLHYFSSPSPARPPIQPENYYPSHRSEASYTSQHQEVIYQEIEQGSTGSTGLYNELLASTGHGIGGMGMVDIRGGLTLNIREVAMDY